MPRRRLLGQLFPSLLLPVSLAVAAMLWFASHWFEVFSLGILARSAGRRGQAAGRAVHPRRSGRRRRRARAPERPAPRPTTAARFVVISPAGQVLQDSEGRRGAGDNLPDHLEVRTALAGQGDSAVRSSATTGQRLLSLAVPIGATGKSSARWPPSLRWPSWIGRSREFQKNLIWIGVVAAGLAALALFLAWRRWARPLEEMRQAAERFARGELGFRLIVPDSEELAGLAEALNQMSQQLQERISTIVRQNNEQRAVLSSMVEGVLAVDNQERVISVNKASGQLLGIDQTQAQGRSLQEVVRNADLRRFVSRACAVTSRSTMTSSFTASRKGCCRPAAPPCTTPRGAGSGQWWC